MEQRKEYIFEDPDLRSWEDIMRFYMTPSEWRTEEEINDLTGYYMNTGLATMFFDHIGRYPDDYYRQKMTYSEVELMLTQAKNLHIVMGKFVPKEYANAALANWKIGKHDT